MNWSDEAWASIESLYAKTIEMPFIQELIEGTLPKEKFQFYMAQDSLYLEHFGRALATIGAKTEALDDVLAYFRFAENAIVVESELHHSYFHVFGVEDRGTLQPACHHYIHFLKSTAAYEPVEVAMAATLPCFWIYQQVGDYILKQQSAEGNPYQKWIETYGGEDFASVVKQAITRCDAAAEATTPAVRHRMTEAFITASRLEYDFWTAAYTLRGW